MRLVLIALFALFACGRQESTSKTSPQETQVTTQAPAAKKVPEGMPRYLMVKVPVDASGQENLAALESREVSDGATMTTADGALKAFETAKTVTVSDELDQTTSTQSWGWYLGRNLGRGIWWGRNPYLYYNNFAYGYYYGAQYHFGGFNYYYWYNF